MDDLISREALQEALCADTEEGIFEFTEEQADAADKIIRYVVKTIQSVPSVPAVPLEPLCEFLYQYDMPCEMCEDYLGCSEDQPCGGGDDGWKIVLTKWMEGLNGKTD